MNINSAFPSNYIKASDLNGSAVVVTIADVKVEGVGRDKDVKPVVYFVGKQKGMVLNRTNSKKIAEIAGSQDTEDWQGTKIAIYPTTTEFAGEEVECIRVKAPKAATNGNGRTAARPEPEPPTTMTEPVYAREPGDDDIQF